MYIINWYESYRDLGRKLTEKKREVKRLEQENAELRQQRDKLLAALNAINKWLGTDDGCYMLPLEPPWYTQMCKAIASVEASDAAPD